MLRSPHLRCLFVAAALSFAALVQAEQISIRADPWLPYNGIGGKVPAGYMIDIATRVAALNGHTIDYANMPWDDALASVRKGDNDCVAGAARDDADDFMFPALSFGKSQNAFFGMAESSWRFTGLDSLASVRLAVIDEYSYSDELDAYIKAHQDDGKVVVISGIRRATMTALSQLAARKTDVFVEDTNVMQDTLTAMSMSERVINLGNLDAVSDVYIACTPAKPAGKVWANMFSDGLATLRASGELTTILARYGLKDWAPTSP